MGRSSTKRRQSSLSIVDFVLAGVILLLFGVIGTLLVVNTSQHLDQIIVLVATSTATSTPAASATPSTTPSATPTPTFTPTRTPTRTRTPTPTATDTPTSPPPPLVNLALTVTPAPPPIDTTPGAFVPPPLPAPLREFDADVINIALLGSDKRPDTPGWRTDVVILVSIDPSVPSLTMLSLPRDLWVYIPNWQWTRINLADAHGATVGFPGGGPGLIKQTIQYNLGIPVQYFARVNFEGFRHLIDSVGGVDVIADCPLYDIFPDVPEGQSDILNGEALQTVITGTIDIPVAGVYRLDGKHALWYARSRKTTSDFDRSRRQQRVLRGLWGSIQQQDLVGQLPALWESLAQTVETDLTLNDVLYLTQIGQQLDATRIRSRFIDNTMLHFFVSSNGANVYAYNYDELEPVLDEAFSELPTNIAAQAGTLVEVWNGTTNAYWDLVAADRLGWAGFGVWSNGIADHVYERTTLIDYSTTNKGSRLAQLAQLFRVSSADIIYQPDPNSPVAHRVIVGNNFQPCLRAAPVAVATATPTVTPSP